MGLLDKLFGKNAPPAAATPPSEPTTTMPPATPSAASTSPVASDVVPARRERSKPGSIKPVGAEGEENAALLAAITAVVAADNAQTRRALYATILESHLMLVAMGDTGKTDEELGTGEVTLQQGQQLQLATMRDPNGRTFLPAFTDVERLAKTLPEEGRYLRLTAQGVCQMFLQGTGEAILINPGQPPSGAITRAEAEILAAGGVPEVGENGQLQGTAQQQMRISIGKPATAPAESFVEAIRAAAREQFIVREVHVFLAGIQDQPPRLMVGILVDAGLTPEQMHPSFEAVGKAAYEARGDTEAFDMMPLNDEMIGAVRPMEGIVYSRDQQV